MPAKTFKTCKILATLGVVLAFGALPVSADELNGTAADAAVEVEVGPGGGSAVPTATASAPDGGATTTSTSDSVVTSGNGGPVRSDTGPNPPAGTPAAIEVGAEAEAGATAGDGGASAAAGTAAAVAAPEPGAVGSATSTHASSDSGDGTEQQSDEERTAVPATPVDDPTPRAQVEAAAEAETAPSDEIDVTDAAAAAAAAGSAGGATGPEPMTSHHAATATSSTTNGTDAAAGGGPDDSDPPPSVETDTPSPGENQSAAEAEAEVTVRSDAASASAAAAGGSAASQAPYGSDSSTAVATATSVDGGSIEVSNEDRSEGATTPASAIGHELAAEAEAIQAGRTSAAAASAAGAGAGADVVTSTDSTEDGAAAAAAAAPNVDVSTSVTPTLARTSALAENPDCDGAAAAVAVVFAEQQHEREAESATACSIELVLELSFAADGTVQVDVTEQIDDPMAPPTTSVDAQEVAEAEAEAATVDGSAAAAASAAAAGLGSVTSSQVSAYAPLPDVVTLEPARLLDTRPNGSTVDDEFVGAGKVPGGEFTKVRIAGRGGVDADAAGVELNLTAIQNEQTGFATAYPCTATPPNASTLNYTPGVNIANAITVALDTNGDVCIFTQRAAHFAIDVVAYIPASSDVVTLEPARLLDTRPNGSTVDDEFVGAGKVPGGEFTKVRIAGRGGVDADAVGVELNLTAIQNEQTGFATAYPCTATPPNASTLNYTPGVNIANAITVALDTNGDVCIFTQRAAHFAIDVVAYIPASSDVVTLEPARLLDTRPNGSTVDDEFVGAGKVPGGEFTKVRIAGRGGVDADAVGVELNLTAIQNEQTGFATAYPCTATPPNASTLNYTPGVNIANAITVALDTNGDVCIFTQRAAHFAIDVVAYVAD